LWALYHGAVIAGEIGYKHEADLLGKWRQPQALQQLLSITISRAYNTQSATSVTNVSAMEKDCSKRWPSFNRTETTLASMTYAHKEFTLTQ